MNHQNQTEERVPVGSSVLFGVFVTARLKGGVNGEPRQGWVESVDPLKIRGESGTLYECEGTPIVVVNPPKQKGHCEDCGTKTIDRCPTCGAPQCCPACCAEEERRLAEGYMKLHPDAEWPLQSPRNICEKCNGDGYVVKIVRGPQSQAGVAEDCECQSPPNAKDLARRALDSE